MPGGLQEWRIRKLMEMGSNAYRTSHNPTSPEFMDPRDRLGTLVLEQNRHFGHTYSPKTPRGTKAEASSWPTAKTSRSFELRWWTPRGGLSLRPIPLLAFHKRRSDCRRSRKRRPQRP